MGTSPALASLPSVAAAHDQHPGAGRSAVLDGPAVRRWADVGLAALVAAQEEIDRLNVYPVADADTGTNLVRTMRAGVEALAAARPEPGADSLAAVCETLASALLRGACGNSGTLLSQLLRGLADAARGVDRLDGPALAAALTSSAALARAALARPVEGTILSVADAAATAATAAAAAGADLAAVVTAARTEGQTALASTPDQLPALHGRVDAGGRGLVVLLEALEAAVTGSALVDRPPAATVDRAPLVAVVPSVGTDGGTTPAHEVMYLLDTGPGGQGRDAERMAALRAALDRLGDSVVVVGGNGLWHVHAHVDDIGAAIEVGLDAGRPHRVRVVRLEAAGDRDAVTTQPTAGQRLGERLSVLAVLDAPGLEPVFTSAGARLTRPDQVGMALARTAEDAGSPLVAVLPSDPDTLTAALGAASHDRRLRVVRSRSLVQAMAALAVHEADRDPDRDLLEMSTAAAACRHGLVEVAEGEGMTSAGRCRPGDVLGHVEGDVAVIGADLVEVALQVVERLLGGGGELVTLVSGAPAQPGLADRVAQAVRRQRPDVDVMTYDGGQPSSYLLVGVE
jgi:fatty acid kinase